MLQVHQLMNIGIRYKDLYVEDKDKKYHMTSDVVIKGPIYLYLNYEGSILYVHQNFRYLLLNSLTILIKLFRFICILNKHTIKYNGIDWQFSFFLAICLVMRGKISYLCIYSLLKLVWV